MSMTILFRTPHPNRLEIHMSPGTRGPMKSPSLGEMDPNRDLTIYADGRPMKIANWAWDPLGNRYVIFMTEDITGELLQVIHHVPYPAFLVASNPALYNLSQGNRPCLVEEN